jgi:hypothetical protein
MLTTKRLLMALLAVDAAGGAVAVKHRVAGEPFGLGGSLDVRTPAVVVLWGTALSAPITSLGLAIALYRHRPGALRVLGAMFAMGPSPSRRSGDDARARGLAGRSSWHTCFSPAHWLSVRSELIKPKTTSAEGVPPLRPSGGAIRHPRSHGVVVTDSDQSGPGSSLTH